VISNCQISHIGSPSEVWSGGIRMDYGSSRNQILDNYIIYTSRGGVHCGIDASNCVVRGNTIRGCYNTSLEVLDIELWNPDLHNNAIVEDNSVEHWMSMAGVTNAAVRRNTVKLADDYENTADYPRFSTGLCDLEAVNTTNSTFTDNELGAGNDLGISESDAVLMSNLYFAYNDIHDLQWWGAQIQGYLDPINGQCTYQYFYKNNFHDMTNTTAGYGYGLRFNGGSRNITVDSNTFSGNANASVQMSGTWPLENSDNNLFFTDNTFNDANAFSLGPNQTYLTNFLVEGSQGSGAATVPPNRGNVPAAPTAVASLNSLNVKTGEAVSFDAGGSSSPSGAIVRRLWDFGEGVPTTDMKGTHVFVTPGAYRGTLVVYDAAGRSAIQEFTINVTSNDAAPAGKPVISSQVSGGNEIFSWNRVEGATGYTIKYWTTGNEAYATTVDYPDYFGYSYQIMGGASMTGLNFTVTPYNGAGAGTTSDAAAQAPTALTLTAAPAAGALNLSWNALAGAYYTASYSPAGDQNVQTTPPLTGTSVTLPGLAENTSYSVYVTAVMSDGSRVRSNTLTATTGYSDAAKVLADKNALTWDKIKKTNKAEDYVTANLSLPTQGAFGSAISWSSDAPGVITSDGSVIPSGTGDTSVTLTATIASGASTATRDFDLTVKQYLGYTYLTDLPLISSSYQYWTNNLSFDRDFDGGDISINGNDYAKGIVACSPSVMTYSLNSNYNTFQVNLGVMKNPYSGTATNTKLSTVTFQVLKDVSLSYNYRYDGNGTGWNAAPPDSAVLATVTMKAGDPMQTLTLDVTGVNTISLREIDNYGYGVWADAKLSTTMSDAEIVAADKAVLTFGTIGRQNPDAGHVTSSLNLPAKGLNGSVISWSSSDPAVVNPTTGAVTTPGDADAHVTLTATLIKGNAVDTVVFNLTVPALSGPGDFALTVTPIVGIGANKGIIWAGASLTVTGSVNYPGANVTVNGVTASWTDPTHFSAAITPILGTNRITVTASLEGQTRTQSLNILNALMYSAWGDASHPNAVGGDDRYSPIGKYIWLGSNVATFTVNVPAAGNYQLYMCACTETGGTNCRVSVNGAVAGSYPIPTTYWSEYGYVKNVPVVTLNRGANTIVFTCTSGGCNFAYILLIPLSSADSLTLKVDQSDATRLRIMPSSEGFGTFGITGSVNYPGAAVTVNGSSVWWTSDTAFIAQPPISYGNNPISIAASLSGETVNKVVNVSCADAYPVANVGWNSITGAKGSLTPDGAALGGAIVWIGASGNGNGTIPFNVSVPADGNYKLMLRYATVDGPMTLAVRVDGAVAGTFTVPNTSWWDDYRLADGIALPLTQGEHTIAISCTSGDGNIDLIALALGEAATPWTLTVNAISGYHDNVNAYYYLDAVSTINVAGKVSDPTAAVTVNGTKVSVGGDGSYSQPIPARFGLNTVTVAATLNGLTKSVTFNAFNGYASIAGRNGWGNTGDFIAPDAYLPGYDPNWWWNYALQLDPGISASSLVSNPSSPFPSFIPAPAGEYEVWIHYGAPNDSAGTISVDGQTLNVDFPNTDGSYMGHVLMYCGDVTLSGASDSMLTLTCTSGSIRFGFISLAPVVAASDATLASLTVNPAALDQVFNSNLTSYTAKTETDSANIAARASNPDAIVTGDLGTHTLAVGDNTFTVTVTSADGSQTKVYTVVITRTVYTPPLPPLELTVDQKGGYVTVPVTYKVSGTVSDNNAVVTVNGVAAAMLGGGVFEANVPLPWGASDIKVVATRGGDTQTKSVSVYNCYRYTVGNGGTVANPGEPQHQGSVSWAIDGWYYWLAANGSTPSYTASFKANAPAGAYEVYLQYSNDGPQITFQVAQGDQVLTVPYKTTGWWDTPMIVDCGRLTINGTSPVNVTVISGYCNFVGILMVPVAAVSDDASLSGLTVSKGTLTPAFDAGVTEYTVSAASDVTSITIAAAANDPKATVSGDIGEKPLNVGKNTFTVTVTAEDGTTRDYTIAVTRESPIDKNALALAIAQAEAMNGADWTADTWAALLDALGYAKDVFANSEDQAEIYGAARALVSAMDNLKTPDIACDVKSMAAKIGKPLQIPCTWNGTGTLTFTTSNAAVCGVSQSGVLSPLKAGIAVITITAPNGAKTVFAVTVTA